MTPEAKKFANDVLQSKLIDRATLNSAFQDFQKSSGNVDIHTDFAKFLVARNLLTKYQAKRLLAGRNAGFFLGGCRILDRVGEGGMGVVYLARQERLEREVAVKVLPFRTDFDPDVIKRFYREARAAARLQHPNIVQVFDVNQEGDTHYIIMELVNGKNLHDIIKKQGPFSVADSVSLIRQAAEGLGHAHANGVIHRDIKPSNLVLEGDRLKVLDLGLARHESDEQITGDRSLLGTLDYMSPEQCENAADVDHRSDIYSLGCTWYHLLVGNAPFADRPATGKLLGHIADLLPSISDADPRVPVEIAVIVSRMTARKPEERYQSTAELITDLDSISDTWDQATIVGGRKISTETPPLSTDKVSENEDNEYSLVDARDHSSDLEVDDEDSDYQTIVHEAQSTWSISVAYLITVMMALVLGGVYFGIRLIKDRLATTETIVINVPEKTRPATPDTVTPMAQRSETDPDTASSPPQTETQDPWGKGDTSEAESSPESGGSPAPQIKSDGQVISETNQPSVPIAKVDSEKMQTDPPTAEGKPESHATPSRKPREMVIREFKPGWDAGLVSGDTLTLIEDDGCVIDRLIHQNIDLTVQGTESDHALVYCKIDQAESAWAVSDARLTMRYIDLVIDLTESRSSQFQAFQLDRASLSLSNCNVTVLPSTSTRWENASIVNLQGANEWDESAAGNSPSPLEITIDNCLFRGIATLLHNSSPQSVFSMSNSVVAGSGPIVHAFHNVERKYAHQKMQISIQSSTTDIEQPVVTVDCRPFTLRPVPMAIQVRQSIVTTLGTVANYAPLIYWPSPASRSSVADAVSFVGDGNVYLRRAYGLMSKAISGEVEILVQQPADWSRQQLGQDTGSEFIDTKPRSRLSEWHERTPRDFTSSTLLHAIVRLSKDKLPGAEVRSLKTPKRLPANLR